MPQRNTEVPQYMQSGSEGPHVNLLLAFLVGAGFVKGADVIYNGVYGPVTTAGVEELQVEAKLDDVDGHFGPATRAAAKERYGFDFTAAALGIPGVTKFLQPDGETIRWARPRAA